MILNKEEIQKAIEDKVIIIENSKGIRYNPNSINVTLNNQMSSYIPVNITRDIRGSGKHKRTVHVVEKDKLTIIKNPNYMTIKNMGSYKDDIVLDYTDESIEKYHFEIPPTGLILLPNMIYLAQTNERCTTEEYMLILDGLRKLSAIGLEINISSKISFKQKEPQRWDIQIMVHHPIMVYPDMEIGKVLFVKK